MNKPIFKHKTDFDNPFDLVIEWYVLAVRWRREKGEDFPLPADVFAGTREFFIDGKYDESEESTTRLQSLLTSWYLWWANTDVVPNKLPQSLHVRTALYLFVEGILSSESFNVRESILSEKDKEE